MEGRIKVKRMFQQGVPPAFVERNKLLDTLVSMIRNSVEAMPDEGTLTVSTRNSRIKGNPCIEITISDTGAGIPTSDLSKIFDLFFTTKDEGLGFGLWRDKAFIKGLGGDIEVKSREGEGSTFVIRIPVDSGIGLGKSFG